MADEKLDLLKGMLDLLVLQILSSMGPLHGYGIARRLEQTSGEQLAMNEGTIYASLIRLQHRRLVKATWGTSENNRRAKFYRITAAGRRRRGEQEAGWKRLVAAMSAALNTQPGEV
jgi:transcriptional regulator